METIIYEDIPSNHEVYTFGYAKYGHFKVIMIKSSPRNEMNGFINISDLCKQGNKEFKSWTRNKESKILLEHFKKSIGSEIIVKIPNITALLRGTYVHTKLITHIASWVSTEFAFWVSEIVDNFIKKEYDDTIALQTALLGKKDRSIKRRDNKIDALTEKIDLLIAQSKEIMDKNEKSMTILDDNLAYITDDLKLANDKLDVTNDSLYDVKAKLGIAITQRVIPPKDESKCETLAVIKLDNPKSYLSTSGEEIDLEYFIAKRQRATITDCLAKNPGKVLFRSNYHPNAQIMFTTIKDALKGHAIFKHGHFTLVDISERRLLRVIDYLEKERGTIVLEDPYSKLGCAELRTLWRQNNLKGFSRLSKEELIKGLTKLAEEQYTE